MATHKTIDIITCPHCGHEQKMTVWGVIDGEVNTKTKSKIINGTFFDQKCKNCGETFAVAYPTLFEDDVHHAMIYYTQTHEQEITAENAIAGRRSVVEAKHDYSIRLTKTPQRFREKIRILDCCLDDRIIEIMKVALLEKLNEDGVFGHVDEVLCWCGDDGNFELEIFGDRHCIAGVKREFYDYLVMKCKASLDRQDPNPIIVDLTWAVDFMIANNFKCI